MQLKCYIKFVNVNIQFTNTFRKDFWTWGWFIGSWMQRQWTGRTDCTLVSGFYYLIQVLVGSRVCDTKHHSQEDLCFCSSWSAYVTNLW